MTTKQTEPPALKCYRVTYPGYPAAFVWAPRRAKAVWACARALAEIYSAKPGGFFRGLRAVRWPLFDKMPQWCQPMTPHSEEYIREP